MSHATTSYISSMDTSNIEAEKALEIQRLRDVKLRLRATSDVDEQIDCRIEIGRCTQRIRRLDMELQEAR
jgi:hypothetical protein